MTRARKPREVAVYRVGGSVRDELLGRAVADRDWVVVGATPEMLLATGYRPVGRDFPVFLHPDTHEEYALARTERKHGRGYRGFEFFASPEVTLEDDLRRRDLTINAMARAEDGRLIDPFGGRRDLEAKVLRHVSPAFVEDPVRLLRVARFAARWPAFGVAPETMALLARMVEAGEVDALVPERVWQEFARGLMTPRPSRMFEVLRVARFAARFGFAVAPETEALMRTLVAADELAELAPERVWQELSRGLMEPQPSRMLAVLRDCGALAQLLPEVDVLYGIPQPLAHHPEFDTGVHVAQALDWAARHALPLPARYAVLLHDLGKARTAPAAWPRHIAHEARGVRLAEQVSARLRVPQDCRDAARLAAGLHLKVHRAADLRPATILDLLLATDALRRPERLDVLLAACAADVRSRPGFDRDYAPEPLLREALAVVRGVDAAGIAREVTARAGNARSADAVPAAIRRARLAALRAWRDARSGAAAGVQRA